MNPGSPIPSIDVAEAERRLREDADRPLLVDVRELTEFVEVRAPGAVLMPMSTFAARAGELPADRPLMLV
jgi:rhodanese-related sulfurtransferase